MAKIIAIISLTLCLISYLVQRYVMKLSHRDMWKILKYDLTHDGFSNCLKAIIGIILVICGIAFY